MINTKEQAKDKLRDLYLQSDYVIDCYLAKSISKKAYKIRMEAITFQINDLEKRFQIL